MEKPREDTRRQDGNPFIAVLLRNMDLPKWQMVPLWPLGEDILGFSYNEIVQPSWWFENMHSEDRTRGVQFLRKQALSHYEATHEFRFKCRNGALVPIAETLIPVDESYAKAVSIWRDANVLGQLSKFRIEPHTDHDSDSVYRAQLTGTLAAGLLHESKQPIATISLAVENALTRIADLPNSEEADYLTRKLRKIRAATEQMLSLAQSVSGAADGVSGVQICSMVDISKDALRAFEDELKRRGSSTVVKQDVEGGDSRVCADAVLLKHAILNLLINAEDAIDQRRERDHSGLTGAVLIRTYTYLGMACIEVSDNGIGISNKAHENLLEMYRTKKKGGSGVGLSFVDKVVSSYGGDISIEKRKGWESSFVIKIPRYRVGSETIKHFMPSV